MWLLLLWRILMAGRLLTRGFAACSACCVAMLQSPETADHLVLGCSFACYWSCLLLFSAISFWSCILLFSAVSVTCMFNLITGASEIDKEDDMFVLIAPQNAVGNCIIDVKILCLSIFS